MFIKRGKAFESPTESNTLLFLVPLLLIGFQLADPARAVQALREQVLRASADRRWRQ